MKLFEKLCVKDAPGAASVTLHEYVSNRSVALLLRSEPSRLEIGSAVAIQIGRTFLLATAAHNLKGLNVHQIEAVPAGRLNMPLLPLRRMGTHQLSMSKNIDVAWIELDVSAHERPGIVFATLDQMGTPTIVHGLKPCFVQGFPSEVVRKVSNPAGMFLAESDGFLTLLIPSHARRTAHEPLVDIAVEYPPHDGSLDDRGVPNPPGVSGGGFWLCPRFDDSLIWTPDAARLLGLARGWWKTEKELVATRIEHWLDLVAEDFPDVGPQIREAQDRLRES
jgi:hypothetical protein